MRHTTHERRITGRNTVPLLLAAGLTALALTLSGCGKGMGGGASYEPMVAILPDEDAVEEAGAGPAANVEVAGYGTLKGRVVVDGTVTVPGPIQPTKDPVCIAQAPIPNDRIVTGEGGGLGDVFIYLPKAPAGARQPDSFDPVELDQHGCRFIPHALLIHTDQIIDVKNSDATLHNTHTNPQRNSVTNLSVPPNSPEVFPYHYARSEKQPVSVTCDIHPWMQAYQLPLDHPYGVVTAKDGSFEIADLPAGKHEFTIWHEVPGVVNSRYAVEIPVDGTAEVEIKIPAQSLAAFRGLAPKRVVLSMIP